MISIIVAFDKNQLIGNGNRLPWHYQEDLNYFKKTTMNHDILMGRKTFESILAYTKRPLPGRHHLVLTHSQNYDFPEVTTIDDLPEFLKSYPTEKELFIIGGSSVYEQALPYADRLYITRIDREFVGDVYFPTVDWTEWSLIVERHSKELRFARYERRGKKCPTF